MFNTGTNSYILEFSLELNLTEAAVWLSSNKAPPCPTTRSKWQANTIQQYKISVIPSAKAGNVYFHQHPNVFSHSIEGSDILCGNVNAAIDLEDFCARFNIEELEWQLW